MDQGIEKLRLGELAEKFVPRDKLPPETTEQVTRLQAALLLAEELGLDKGKKTFDRIRPISQIIEELKKSGVENPEALIDAAAKGRIGKEELPSTIPSYGDLLTSRATGIKDALPAEAKNALLAMQASERIKAALERGETFPMPRIDDKDPPYLKQAQAALAAILAAKQNGVELSPEDLKQYKDAAERGAKGANESWTKLYGEPLLTKEEPKTQPEPESKPKVTPTPAPANP